MSTRVRKMGLRYLKPQDSASSLVWIWRNPRIPPAMPNGFPWGRVSSNLKTSRSIIYKRMVNSWKCLHSTVQYRRFCAKLVEAWWQLPQLDLLQLPTPYDSFINRVGKHWRSRSSDPRESLQRLEVRRAVSISSDGSSRVVFASSWKFESLPMSKTIVLYCWLFVSLFERYERSSRGRHV